MNYLYIICFLPFLFICESSNVKLNEEYIVVIDPGHGGKDTGAIGRNALYEKEVNLIVALMTKELLNDLDKNITVVLTRNKDVYISLGARPKIAKAFKADLFISLHCDASLNKKRVGSTIYLQNGTRANSEIRINNYKKSLKFSLILDEILNTQLNIKSNGIAFSNYQVLRETIDYVPSLLIEMGFITNDAESDYFRTKGQQGIASAITKAILNYKKLK